MTHTSHPRPISSPVSAVDLTRDIEQADRVLVATVRQVRPCDIGRLADISAEADPAYDQLYAADLSVLRTLVGETTDTPLNLLFLVGQVPSRPWMTFTPGQTVLLFLRAIAKDTYVPVVPTGIALPAWPQRPVSSEVASPPAAVANELEQVILAANPETQADQLVTAAIARTTLHAPLDVSRLATLPLQSPLRRAAWIAIALAEGHIAVLPEVPPLFAQPETSALANLQALIAQQIRTLQTPAARAALRPLLSSNYAELALAAIVALRQLYDPATLPDLVAALQHRDQAVRYQAVMGLAELEPAIAAGPNFHHYRDHEAVYLQRWQTWWQSQPH
jgi:hypothetical protein